MKEWIKAAQGLKPGQRLRMLCECAPHRSPSLMVEHSEDGSLRAWCFRCKEPGMYVSPPHMSLGEKLARAKELREQDNLTKSVSLPAPQVWDPTDWPLFARVWLYKAGFNDDDIQLAGIYFHPPTQRVVLPVVDGAEFVYWQARGFQEHTAKYINPRVDRAKIVYTVGNYGPTLCLTEDILSALKIGKHHFAWSILGTDLKDEVLARIIQAGYNVVVWLDPDEPGQQAAKKICHRLSVFGVPHTNIVSPKDPKLLTYEEIDRTLWGVTFTEE